ncbi:MAG TPA: ferredoxin [Verrucomicrobiae bacterium]
MASPELRLPENAPGPFYVTSECIDCDLCREVAPSIYRRNEEVGTTVVYHQPVNAEERALAIEGMDGCPVEAIGCTEPITQPA